MGCYYYFRVIFFNQSLSLYINYTSYIFQLNLNFCYHKLLKNYSRFNSSKIKCYFNTSHILVFSLENMFPYKLHFTYLEHNTASILLKQQWNLFLLIQGLTYQFSPKAQRTSEKPVPTLAQCSFQLLLTINVKL